MTRGIIVAGALACVLAVTVIPGGAQVPDHLKCQEVKDPSGKREFTADVGGLALEPGCVVKLPAKLLCEQATTANEQPPNPGTFAPAPAGQFLCYKAKCPRRPAAARFVRDRFGDHAVEAKATQLVCAPSVDAPPGSCVDGSDFDQPCGADGGGRCFLGAFPSTDLLCVDAPSCSGSCTSDDQCGSGQVCAGAVEISLCCTLHP
jgi:hypothetical protein